MPWLKICTWPFPLLGASPSNLPTYPPTYPPIYSPTLPTYPPSTHLPTHLVPTYTPTYPSSHLPTHLLVCWLAVHELTSINNNRTLRAVLWVTIPAVQSHTRLVCLVDIAVLFPDHQNGMGTALHSLLQEIHWNWNDFTAVSGNSTTTKTYIKQTDLLLLPHARSVHMCISMSVSQSLNF